MPLGKNEVVKEVSKTEAVVGETFVYTINVTNSGQTPVKDVEVLDNLPAELELVPDSLKVDGEAVQNTGEGNQIKMVLSEVNGGQIREVSFEVNAIKDGNGVINTAKVTDRSTS